MSDKKKKERDKSKFENSFEVLNEENDNKEDIGIKEMLNSMMGMLTNMQQRIGALEESKQAVTFKEEDTEDLNTPSSSPSRQYFADWTKQVEKNLERQFQDQSRFFQEQLFEQQEKFEEERKPNRRGSLTPSQRVEAVKEIRQTEVIEKFSKILSSTRVRSVRNFIDEANLYTVSNYNLNIEDATHVCKLAAKTSVRFQREITKDSEEAHFNNKLWLTMDNEMFLKLVRQALRPSNPSIYRVILLDMDLSKIGCEDLPSQEVTHVNFSQYYAALLSFVDEFEDIHKWMVQMDDGSDRELSGPKHVNPQVNRKEYGAANIFWEMLTALVGKDFCSGVEYDVLSRLSDERSKFKSVAEMCKLVRLQFREYRDDSKKLRESGHLGAKKSRVKFGSGWKDQKESQGAVNGKTFEKRDNHNSRLPRSLQQLEASLRAGSDDEQSVSEDSQELVDEVVVNSDEVNINAIDATHTSEPFACYQYFIKGVCKNEKCTGHGKDVMVGMFNRYIGDIVKRHNERVSAAEKFTLPQKSFVSGDSARPVFGRKLDDSFVKTSKKFDSKHVKLLTEGNEPLKDSVEEGDY